MKMYSREEIESMSREEMLEKLDLHDVKVTIEFDEQVKQELQFKTAYHDHIPEVLMNTIKLELIQKNKEDKTYCIKP